MSIATELEKLTSDISNAYSVVEEKGGVIPDKKNTDNLAAAIESIEGDTDSYDNYGIVWYYDSSRLEVEVEYAENCSVELVNIDLFAEQIKDNDMPGLQFDYQQGVGWQCWELSESTFTTEQLLTDFGIQVDDLDESTEVFVSFDIRCEKVPDDSKLPKKKVLTVESDLDQFCEWWTASFEYYSYICKYAFGDKVTRVPNGFLRNTMYLKQVDTSHADGVVEIGDCVFASCPRLSGDMTFKNVISVGSQFVCDSDYKGLLSLPSVETVGEYFGFSFWQMPHMPNVKVIGNRFMEASRIEGFDVAFPELVSIGARCVARCQNLRSVNLESPWNRPKLESIGPGFADECPAIVALSGAEDIVDKMAEDTDYFHSFTAGYGGSEEVAERPAYVVGIRVGEQGGVKSCEEAVKAKFPNHEWEQDERWGRKWR